MYGPAQHGVIRNHKGGRSLTDYGVFPPNLRWPERKEKVLARFDISLVTSFRDRDRERESARVLMI